MDKVFHVELSSEESCRYRCTQLDLPATDYELLDALERLQINSFDDIYIEKLQFNRFQAVSKYLPDDIDLVGLNSLAEDLSPLEPEQSTVFEALLQMATSKNEEAVTLETLRLLAINADTDCCHIFPQVRTDTELGRFYAENGRIASVKSVPPEIFDLLDFAGFGEKARIAEGGVFVEPGEHSVGGYVVQDCKLKLGCPNSRPVQKPDYAILLELRHDNKTTLLPLPAHEGALATAQQKIGTSDWRCTEIRCVDCCVPALLNSFGSTNDVEYIDRFAQLLNNMSSKELTKIKAILDACQECDLTAVVNIAEDLGKYHFTPEGLYMDDIGMDVLRSSIGTSAAEWLRPYVNLYDFARHCVEAPNCKETAYGLVFSKAEGQAFLSPSPSPAQGGMTEQTM